MIWTLACVESNTPGLPSAAFRQPSCFIVVSSTKYQGAWWAPHQGRWCLGALAISPFYRVTRASTGLPTMSSRKIPQNILEPLWFYKSPGVDYCKFCPHGGWRLSKQAVGLVCHLRTFRLLELGNCSAVREPVHQENPQSVSVSLLQTQIFKVWWLLDSGLGELVYLMICHCNPSLLVLHHWLVMDFVMWWAQLSENNFPSLV